MSQKVKWTRFLEASVVVVGHGSRDPIAEYEFTRLVQRYQERWPHADISHAYVELTSPNISEVLPKMAAQAESRPVVVVPLSLFAAGHVKNELPLHIASIQKLHPQAKLVMTKPLGVHPALINCIAASLQDGTIADDTGASGEHTSKNTEIALSDTSIIVVGRGASDPDANGDFFKVARLICEGLGTTKCFPCFIGITTPRFEDTLQLVARTRPKRLIVVPYFLFHGLLIQRIEKLTQDFATSQPWTKVSCLDPMGSIDNLNPLLDLLDQRIDEALFGGEPLPCTSCQYRVPLGEVAGKVGGLNALLWSVRHSMTHVQATPHTHQGLKRHILVCTNIECAGRGSLAVLQKLRRDARQNGYGKELKITRTSCLGRCGEGPVVVIYPDGIWYRDIKLNDIGEIFTRHLKQDLLLGDKVDTVM